MFVLFSELWVCGESGGDNAEAIQPQTSMESHIARTIEGLWSLLILIGFWDTLYSYT